MKFHGGHLPKIAGRPARVVREAPVPGSLFVELQQEEILFSAAVRDGERVAFGAPLAHAETVGGRIALPAPASGTVSIAPAGKGNAAGIVLNVENSEVRSAAPPHAPERTTADEMRRALADAGIWPMIWSSRTRGMPPLDGTETPNRILVNFVAAEPFRTRGKVVLSEKENRVAAGLRYLPRLLAEYGTIHLVLTDLSDPVAQAIRNETAGYAWIRVEQVPVRYPVESPRVLWGALRRGDERVKKDDVAWVLDVQAVHAVGARMGEGIPVHERIVAVGGPGASEPRHVRVRVGTRLDRFLDPADLGDSKRVLRGGLLRGKPADKTASVGYGDDAFFVLNRLMEREFLSFVNPGFDRTSILPCFASCLTRAADRHVTASLRGERRPCIACGLCEEVCPVGLLPQILHRCLYRNELGEAEELGLNVCIRCGLCSYVCPSKIELRHEFEIAQRQQAAERAETAKAEADRLRHEKDLAASEERKDEWRK